MTNRTLTHIEDRDAALLAGDVAPLSRSAWADNVISFPAHNAAAYGLGGDATELDEDVFHIGSVAVRLVGNFTLPRIRCEGGWAD
jgi:hypothetical protein